MPAERSAVLEGVRKVVIREFEIPEIGPKEGLLKVEMAGVCGSDVKSYRGELYPEKIPFIMGHEILGRIDKVGKEASKQWEVREGDRVVVEARLRCASCYYCLSGNYHLCEKATYHAYGVQPLEKPPHIWGAHGEYLYLTPGTMLHKITEDVSPEAAVLTCAVVGNAVKWVQKGSREPVGKTIVILGPGAQGLAATMIAKEAGFNPIIVVGLESDSKRLSLARSFGATHTTWHQGSTLIEEVSGITRGCMADVVIDLTGSSSGLETCLDIVRKLGVVVYPNVIGKKQSIITPDKIVEKELSFYGVFSRTFQHVQRAIDLILLKKYPLEEMVTHSFPLESAEKAYRVAGGEVRGEDPIKVVIRP